MDYINEKQFLEQSKEIQKVLLDWWINNFSFGDILYHDYYKRCIAFEKWGNGFNCISSRLEGEHLIEFNEIIPLFCEGQLRKFIEENSQSGLTPDKNMEACIQLFKDDGYIDESYNNLGNDMLKAYWKVACKIVEELIIKEK